jgi:hypothetical protein
MSLPFYLFQIYNTYFYQAECSDSFLLRHVASKFRADILAKKLIENKWSSEIFRLQVLLN